MVDFFVEITLSLHCKWNKYTNIFNGNKRTSRRIPKHISFHLAEYPMNYPFKN